MIGRGETPMLERAFPLPSQRHDREPTIHRSVLTSAMVRYLTERLGRILSAVGAFFASGGALS